MKRLFTLFVLSLVAFGTLQATHFMGVNLHYDCISSDTIRLFVHRYYDCEGGATTALPGPPPVPNMTIEGANGATCILPSQIGNWRSVHYIDVTPVCPGTATGCNSTPFGQNAAINGTVESIYTSDWDFSSSQCRQYEVKWSSCCRNGAISSGAGNDGIFVDGLTIDLGLSPCNSSPRFLNPPVFYVCNWAPARFEHQAYDPDGDSLVYRIIPCKQGANNLVGYNPGFSHTAPLGPTWTVTLNNATGDIDLTPNPGNQVVGVLCVEVMEFRNGVHLSSTTRDIQFFVTNCRANQNPVINQLNVLSGANQRGNYALDGAVGIPLSFNVQVMDPDVGDRLTTYFDTLATQIQGLSYTTTGRNPQVITATWTPRTAGRFLLRLVAQDNLCPLPSTSARAIVVEVSPYSLVANVINTPCGAANGAIDLTVAGGNAPFQYQWSNGDTTEDISNLSPGNYSVLVIDQTGDSLQKSFFVNGANIALNAVVVNNSCNNGNSISLNVTGGNPPYTYSWTTPGVGNFPTNMGIRAGTGVGVVVTDASGCVRHGAWRITGPASCFSTIEGIAFRDDNKNCVRDPGEPGLPNTWVRLQQAGISTLTDINGRYHLSTIFSGRDSISVQGAQYYRTICPVGGKDTVDLRALGTRLTYNFAMEFDSIHDLVASHAGPGRARPGFTVDKSLIVRNDGSYHMPATLTWQYDSIFTFITAFSSPNFVMHDPVNRIVRWNFASIPPGGWRTVQCRLRVDSTLGTGVPYTHTLQVDPVVGDVNPLNNTSVVSDTTSNSFDPNDKQALPSQRLSPGWILQDEEMLTYTIRFQNTGTDTAFFVIIKDILDDNTLDIGSLKMMGASHPYSLRVENGNELEFRFDNILLPAEIQDAEASQGYVSFTINRKPNLAYGTLIRNQADIYFDFNSPITTNLVLRSVYDDMIGVGPPNLEVCDGEPVTVFVSMGAAPYVFYWPSGYTDSLNYVRRSTHQVQSFGPQQVRVVDAIGKETLINFTLTPAPAPDADFTFAFSGNTTVDFEGQAGMKSYEWDFGDGNTAIGRSVSHTYASRGVYAVKHWAHNDCGTDTLTKHVDFAVGIPEAEFGSSVEVQPNPMDERAIIRFANPAGQAYGLTLFDTRGSEVCRYPAIRGDHFLVRKGNLPAGIYLFQLEGPHRYYGRLVIK